MDYYSILQSLNEYVISSDLSGKSDIEIYNSWSISQNIQINSPSLVITILEQIHKLRKINIQLLNELKGE